jgi:repressor LexA
VKKELTTKQRHVLDFICKYILDNGYPPSVRDIAKRFSYSPKTAWDYLIVLDSKGYISVTKNISRGIKVL